MAEVAVKSAKAQKGGTEKKTPVSSKAKAELSQSVDSPVEQILHLQRTIGNRAVTRLIQSGAIQAKLTIGKPNDIYEKEADRVADRVMSMKNKSLVNGHSSLAQRESEGKEEKEGVQTKPLAEQITPLIRCQAEEEENQAQPKAVLGGTPEATPNIESNINSMKGSGQPLSESTRAFFEPRFGTDFSQVRVHQNAESGNISASLGARAFTLGKAIWMGQGESTSDKKLMAHELTHVVQQNSNLSRLNVPIIQRDLDDLTEMTITPAYAENLSDEELERHIRYLRDVIIRGHPDPAILRSYRLNLQILEDEEKKRGQSRNDKKALKICGPDVTQWLIKQMITNGKSKIVKEMKESNEDAWFGEHSVGALSTWYNLVKTGGPWDFKTKLGEPINKISPCRQNCNGKLWSITLDAQCMTYEAAANIHYGYVGRMAGFTEERLLSGASDAQVSEGRGETKDDPRDVQAIKKGFKLFDSGNPGGLTKGGLESNYYHKLGSTDGDPQGCKPCPSKL